MAKKFKIDEITLVLIVALIAMAVSVQKGISGPEMEAEKITAMILDNHKISFANNGVIDDAKLEKIESMDYYEFKKSLNAKSDFCVYIEDENGNVLLAKGSSKLSGNGIRCEE